MSLKLLSTQSLLDLSKLFELSRQSTCDSDGQRIQGVPGWDFARITSMPPAQLAAWIECVGYAGHYPAPHGDERIAVELHEDADPARYSYRCPETFRLKYVAATEAAIYAVQASPFLGVIAALLDIPQARCKGIEAPLLDGVLWHLGKARIGAAHTNIWFVRELVQSVDEVFRHFHQTNLPDQGLILSSSMALPDFVRPPRNYRFACLSDVMIDYVQNPCLDRDLLQRILASPADGTLSPVLPVHFDEYSSTLTIRTKIKPWVIKGERQTAAVLYMYQQAGKGRWCRVENRLTPALPHQTVLAVFPHTAFRCSSYQGMR